MITDVVSFILRLTDDDGSQEGASLRVKHDSLSGSGRLNHSEEERYISVMKELQFGQLMKLLLVVV